jgi:hypothetical protein
MSQGQKPVAGGRRLGTEARRRRAEVEARRRQPAGRQAGMRRCCTVLRREARACGRAGV